MIPILQKIKNNGFYHNNTMDRNNKRYNMIEQSILIDGIKTSLLYDSKLYSRLEVNTKPYPVPSKRGFYAWFFKNIPETIATKNCFVRDGFTLLYLGISPSSESSSANLLKRIRSQHMNGNSAGSTLRFSLASILGDSMNMPLIKKGSRIFLGENEVKLNEWLDENARVTFVECEQPWLYESSLIKQLDLPMNLEHNKEHQFYPIMKKIRSDARKVAKGD